MSRIVCPGGYVYDVSVEKCMAQCPAAMEELSTDPNMCVSTIPCPPETTQDAIEPNVCNKTSSPVVGGACASGFSQWSPGFCSVNCPGAYQESFTSCIKKTVLRKDAPPRCDSMFNSFSNGSCNNLSVTAILLLVGAVAAAVLLWRASSCRMMTPTSQLFSPAQFSLTSAGGASAVKH